MGKPYCRATGSAPPKQLRRLASSPIGMTTQKGLSARLEKLLQGRARRVSWPVKSPCEGCLRAQMGVWVYPVQ